MNRAGRLMAVLMLAALGACGSEPEEAPQSTVERKREIDAALDR